jgi:site-specific recombinase XerD
MSLEHVRRLLGHSSFEMVKRYVDLLDEDILAAHEQSGPVDNRL